MINISKPAKDMKDQELLSEFYTVHKKIESGDLALVDRRRELAGEVSHRFKDNPNPNEMETSKIDFDSLIKAVGVGIEYAPLDKFSPAILDGAKIADISKKYNNEIDAQVKKRDMIIKTALSVLGIVIKTI
jgi:hypothetical protein